MRLVAIALTLACVVLMFFVRREYKLALMFMSAILLTALNLPIKSIPAQSALSMGFLVSEIPYIKIHWKRIRRSVLFPYIILVLVSFVIAVITSPHLHEVNLLGFFGLSELLTKQMAVVYAFLALRKCSSIRPLLTVSFAALLVMTVVGIINYATGYSFYVEDLLEDSFSFVQSSRFRVQATFNNPFDYGYICVLLAIIHFYGYLQRFEGVAVLTVVQVCCLFGVLTCNCRTILLCYLVCAVVFAVALQKKRKVKLAVFGGILALMVVSVMFVPSARKLILSVFSIFDPSAVSDGSSIAMRLKQFGTVIYYISSSLIFGRGVHFFVMDLGWDSGSGLEVDTDLYGLEGIYLNLLLERGVVGLLLYLAMLILLIVFIFRYRKLGRKMYALGITVFVLYILFSFMTGELHSAVPSFYIIGYVIANLNLRKRYLEWRKSHAQPEEQSVL